MATDPNNHAALEDARGLHLGGAHGGGELATGRVGD